MKYIGTFIIGAMLTFLAMGITGVSVARADSDSFDLTDLLPDIGRIYREALVTPFQQVESEIYDEDIGNYYHKLIKKCGLDEPLVFEAED